MRQDKARQDKTIQDKTGQDTTRQHKTIQDNINTNPRHNNITQDKIN